MLYTRIKEFFSPPSCKKNFVMASARLNAICNDALDVMEKYRAKEGINDNGKKQISVGR